MRSSPIVRFAIKHPKQTAVRLVSVFLLTAFIYFDVVYEYAYQSDNGSGQEEKTAKESTDEALAVYTFWLMLFTGGLTVSTVGLWLTTRAGMRDQGIDFRKSLKASEESAKAALRTAEVAEATLQGAETPYLVITAEPFGSKEVVDGKIRLTSSDPDIPANYTIWNYGRSPATILEVYQGYRAGPARPEPTSFPPPQSNLFQSEIIPPHGGWGTVRQIRSKDSVASDAAWIAVQIRYADVFGNQFLSSFRMFLNTDKLHYYQSGGVAHNYRRRLSGEDLIVARERDREP